MFVYGVFKKMTARVCVMCFAIMFFVGLGHFFTVSPVISTAQAEYFNPHLNSANPRYLQRSRPVAYGHRAPIVVALTPQEAAHRLARQGYSVRNLWMQGDVYVAQGFDRRRTPVRVVVDPYEGRVLEVVEIGRQARPLQYAVRPPLNVPQNMPQNMQPEFEKQDVIDKRKVTSSHVAAQKRKARLAAALEEKRLEQIEAKKEKRRALAQKRAKNAKSRHAQSESPRVVTFKAPKNVQKNLIDASSNIALSPKPAFAPVEEVRPEIKKRAVDKI